MVAKIYEYYYYGTAASIFDELVFPEFFDLIVSINQIFFCKELSEVVSGQCIYCIT